MDFGGFGFVFFYLFHSRRCEARRRAAVSPKHPSVTWEREPFPQVGAGVEGGGFANYPINLFIAPLLPISSWRGNPCVHLNSQRGAERIPLAQPTNLGRLFCLASRVSPPPAARPGPGPPPPAPAPLLPLRNPAKSQKISRRREDKPRRAATPPGSPSGVFPRLQSLQPQRERRTSAERNRASINKQTPRPGRTTTPRDGPAAHRTRSRRRSP